MKKILLNVEGMSCEHCVKAVTDELIELEGVKSVDVSLKDSNVDVEFNEALISEKEIKDLINEIGYKVVS